tara:strand:+ start:4350 stop:4559 length:210 start_codon:yes stop_codon:yes gene_type:complete
MGVFLLQVHQKLVLLSLYAAVLVLPTVIGRLGELNGMANVGDCLALGDQKLSGFELAVSAPPSAWWVPL